MTAKKKIPTVRMAKPKGRPIQLRYTDPEDGREIRISTGTADEADAESQKKQLEAKLLLGIDAKPRRRTRGGASMAWDVFRQRYYELQLSTIKSAADTESRLDICERILKPRTLGDVANSEALHELQQKLLAGAECRQSPKAKEHVVRPRSPHTVKTNMAVVLAALRWAEYMGWLTSVPRIKRVKTTKLKQMKGRPITTEEFERMLESTEAIVGAEAKASWKYLLRGLWTSGLRLGELLHVHWTDDEFIVPSWSAGPLPVLAIPASMQKNATEEAIPLLPWFETVLRETPEAAREGWAFNPMSLQGLIHREVTTERVSVEWAGKIVGRIGEKAGVVVQPATSTADLKFASAHDLRRSCADRLIAAGVPEREVAAIMRHSSVSTTRRHYAPGSVQRSATVIRDRLRGNLTAPARANPEAAAR